MEVKYYKCDHCGHEGTNLSSFYTISHKWQQAHYDMGEYEYTSNEEDTYHICIKCWEKLKNVIINS